MLPIEDGRLAHQLVRLGYHYDEYRQIGTFNKRPVFAFMFKNKIRIRQLKDEYEAGRLS